MNYLPYEAALTANEIRVKFDALIFLKVNSTEISAIPKGQGHISRILNWAEQKNILGEYKNNGTNETVSFSKKSVRNIYTHSSDDKKLALIEVIPELIKNGVLLEITKKNDRLSSKIFAAKAIIDDETYAVSYVVRSDANGNRYYDHSSIKTTALDQLNDQAPLFGKESNRGISAKTTTSAENSYTQNSTINILKKHLSVND